MNWQQVFEIQDGGYRHLEYLQICIYDVIDIIQIEVPMFLQMLVTMSRILKKWQQFFEMQYGGTAILKSTLPIEPPSREMNS